jgi:hypothetical protein
MVCGIQSGVLGASCLRRGTNMCGQGGVQCVGLAKTVNSPYLTVNLVIPLPNIPYMHCIYIYNWF